jgi:hypothetical protein
MKITRLVPCLILFLLCFFGCKKNDNNLKPVVIDDDFSISAQGWTGDFADYPSIGDISSWELSVSHVNMPSPLVSTKKGIRLSGNNRSDDLFMFLKKKVTGLAPNQTYNVRFEVESFKFDGDWWCTWRISLSGSWIYCDRTAKGRTKWKVSNEY